MGYHPTAWGCPTPPTPQPPTLKGRFPPLFPKRHPRQEEPTGELGEPPELGEPQQLSSPQRFPTVSFFCARWPNLSPLVICTASITVPHRIHDVSPRNTEGTETERIHIPPKFHPNDLCFFCARLPNLFRMQKAPTTATEETPNCHISQNTHPDNSIRNRTRAKTLDQQHNSLPAT